VAPIALWFYYFSFAHGEIFTPFQIGVGFCTSLIVGLYEEYAFRGPLLAAFRERMSVLSTALLTSVIFTVYHIQAQSFRSWGMIFLMGIILANLRFSGLGLGWLALIHGLIDTSYFLCGSISPGPFSSSGLILHAGLLIYAIRTFPRQSKSTVQP
jgi:membrane protease YdiL (CAAX protease family)